MKTAEFESTSVHEQLSALHDGQLSAERAAALVRQSLVDDSLMLQWRSMSAIGSAMVEPRMLITHLQSSNAGDAFAQSVVKPIAEAANDGLWRWKMVAGLAAFAAVSSLIWGLLGNVGTAGTAGINGQLADLEQRQNSQLVATGAGRSAQALITVGGQSSGQEAVMIRDPRLDELLAAHKQFGGSSALHQSAGSLRSVSLDSVALRSVRP
jgi:sigma-E factor negative regulatory protein RseA